MENTEKKPYVKPEIQVIDIKWEAPLIMASDPKTDPKKYGGRFF